MTAPQEVRDRAASLRREGKSYTDIAQILDRPKSTIRGWTRGVECVVPDAVEAKRRLRQTKCARSASRVAQKSAAHLRETWKAEGRTRAAQPNEERFRIIGALYWAEGVKNRNIFSIANTDWRFVRRVYDWLVDEGYSGQIRLVVHYHVDGPSEQLIRAWWLDRLPGLTVDDCRKFQKVTKKTKRKSTKWPYGIGTIYVTSTQLRQQIEGCLNHLRGPDYQTS